MKIKKSLESIDNWTEYRLLLPILAGIPFIYYGMAEGGFFGYSTVGMWILVIAISLIHFNLLYPQGTPLERYNYPNKLYHIWDYDPDGYPAAASYNMTENEITHRFKHYERLSVTTIEEDIEMVILWVELEELTHWAGHCDVEPGHSAKWMHTLLDVSCYIHDSSCFYYGEDSGVIADYTTEEVKLTND